MIVRTVQPGDEEEWLRMRFALWPDSTLDELRAELEGVMADTNYLVMNTAIRV